MFGALQTKLLLVIFALLASMLLPG